MRQFLLQRLLTALLIAAGTVSLVFLFIHVVPGDPIEVMLGESATIADRALLRAALGLDMPLYHQWLHYLNSILHLDFGRSLLTQQPIAAILAQRLPATLQLSAAALSVALVLALPLGVIAAWREGSGWDRGTLMFSTLAVSVPGFWLGPMLILVFALWLGWLPVSGRDHAGSWILPAFTLGVGMAAVLSRMLRAMLLDVLHEDFLRTARAKGLPELSVLTRHALRNAALPMLTIVALQLGALLAGTVITETIFQWPGIGSLTVEAIQRRDYPLVQACVLVISVSYIFINTLTDLAYGLLDPRAR